MTEEAESERRLEEQPVLAFGGGAGVVVVGRVVWLVAFASQAVVDDAMFFVCLFADINCCCS